jgi:hypothetical protein
MTYPSASTVAVNLNQGPFPTIEKYFLYIGEAPSNQGSILYLSTDSDLDEELGAADSELKRQIEAAKVNSKSEKWACVAMPLADGSLWDEPIDYAMTENVEVEGIFICTPVATQADITALNAKAYEIKVEYSRDLFIKCAARGIDSVNESWSEYLSAMNALTDSLAADLVGIVPYIYDDALGMLGGRLSGAEVSVADSPMRVATGALIGADQSTLPVDKNGVRYKRSHSKALHDFRFSVPMYHPQYEGMYWSDGLMLDVTGGDYGAIEYRRIQQKAARRVLVVLTSLIADRRIDSTSVGTEWAIEKLMRPLREMSKEYVLDGIPFVADIKPPQPGDVKIVWTSEETVAVPIKIRPYKSAKVLTAYIVVDRSTLDI